MKIGYARISAQDRHPHVQVDALQAAGCAYIEQEKPMSSKDRPQLEHLLRQLRAGDTLVVWKLDRLGRSLKDLMRLITGFQAMGVHFVSLHEHLDTTTPQGQLLFNVFALLAEFERDLISERTNARLTAGRVQGQPGRPRGLSREALAKAQAVKILYLQQDKTLNEISQILSVGRATIYRYLRYLGVPTDRSGLD